MTETVIIAPARMSADNPAWLRLKAAAPSLQLLQGQDGSIQDPDAHEAATGYVAAIVECLRTSPPCSRTTPPTSRQSSPTSGLGRGGFAIPDFLASLLAFQPQQQRQDGLQHLVVFPMYTQNGSSNRLVEAVLIEVIWPEFIAELEAGRLLQQAVRAHPLRGLHAGL